MYFSVKSTCFSRAYTSEVTMKIGLLGYGTVGKGVYDILEEQDGLEVKYVLDLRDLPELGNKLTKDLNVILSDPEIETVVELIGGMNRFCKE